MRHTTKELLEENPEILKRLAKLMAQQCFRNTVIEDYHAGTSPSTKTGDYSDVVVRTPDGEIPWPEVSRISQDEMKALMIEAVNHTYCFLRVLFDDDGGESLVRLLELQDLLPCWNQPEINLRHSPEGAALQRLLRTKERKFRGRAKERSRRRPAVR